jgi:hypothetical protein
METIPDNVATARAREHQEAELAAPILLDCPGPRATAAGDQRQAQTRRAMALVKAMFAAGNIAGLSALDDQIHAEIRRAHDRLAGQGEEAAAL